jgi:hypothetical protein
MRFQVLSQGSDRGGDVLDVGHGCESHFARNA